MFTTTGLRFREVGILAHGALAETQVLVPWIQVTLTHHLSTPALLLRVGLPLGMSFKLQIS